MDRIRRDSTRICHSAVKLPDLQSNRARVRILFRLEGRPLGWPWLAQVPRPRRDGASARHSDIKSEALGKLAVISDDHA
jgi:hypothetical protein